MKLSVSTGYQLKPKLGKNLIRKTLTWFSFQVGAGSLDRREELLQNRRRERFRRPLKCSIANQNHIRSLLLFVPARCFFQLVAYCVEETQLPIMVLGMI